MDAPKPKRDKDKRKRGLSRRLPVEFLAEYPMEECINRLLRRNVEDRELLEGGAHRFWLKGMRLRLEPWDAASTRVIVEYDSSLVRPSCLAIIGIAALIIIGTVMLIDTGRRLLLLISTAPTDSADVLLGIVGLVALTVSLVAFLRGLMELRGGVRRSGTFELVQILGNTTRGSFTREKKIE